MFLRSGKLMLFEKKRRKKFVEQGIVSCFSYIVAHWRTISFEFLKEQHVTSSEMSWWQAAYAGCGDGVLLPHGDVSDSVHNNMEYWRYYWIGALDVYTPWKWTGKNIIIIGRVVFNSEHHNQVSCNFDVDFTENRK